MKKAVREPIATWWRIGQYKPTIEPLRVVAFTGSFVTYLEKEWRLSGPDALRERRERRDDIFPTFSEAKLEMVTRAAKKVERAKEELQRCRSFLGNVESIKMPSNCPSEPASPLVLVGSEGLEPLQKETC